MRVVYRELSADPVATRPNSPVSPIPISRARKASLLNPRPEHSCLSRNLLLKALMRYRSLYLPSCILRLPAS